MSSLKSNFDELVAKIKQGREFTHASFEPVYPRHHYFIFVFNTEIFILFSGARIFSFVNGFFLLGSFVLSLVINSEKEIS